MMRQTIRSILGWAMLGTAAALGATVGVPAASASGDGYAVAVKTGSTWTVDKTTRLTRLTVGRNALVSAPKGESLTLTVNGIDTAIGPGAYRGDLVLTVTRDIPVRFLKLPPEHFRTGIYVDDVGYVAARSVAAAVVGGSVTGSNARGVSITAREGRFNGIIVTGDARYSIVKPRIRLVGNSPNDFDGFGAGIVSGGHAKVLVDGATITARGVARDAVFVGGHSTMTVNNSTIRVYNGKLPSGYRFSLVPGKMRAVPWMLGVTGNVRATLLADYGTAYYNNDRIIAQGWGALSTDGVRRTRMYVSNSTIETVDSGYGSYSLGNSHNHFSHCTFRVADMALIMSNGGSGTFTDATVVDSRRFGVIMHSPDPRVGTLTIDKGSVFNTRSTVIQVKGLAANIVVDHAQLHAGNGILLQAMVNDDPFAPLPKAGTDTPVRATFRHVALHGDIINSRTGQGGMTVALEDAGLTGAISTATAAPAKGVKPAERTYYLIGDVRNVFASTAGYGLDVSLDGRSSWVVDKTSYLTGLSIGKGAAVMAPKGFRVTFRLDGKETPLQPGTYHGNIVLAVSRAEAAPRPSTAPM